MNQVDRVATTDQMRMRADMENAPLGEKLLLINEGGVLVPGVLTRDTLSHFIEWQRVPKRALKKESK